MQGVQRCLGKILLGCRSVGVQGMQSCKGAGGLVAQGCRGA